MWQTVSEAATGDWKYSVADSAQCSNSRLQHIADMILIGMTIWFFFSDASVVVTQFYVRCGMQTYHSQSDTPAFTPEIVTEFNH